MDCKLIFTPILRTKKYPSFTKSRTCGGLKKNTFFREIRKKRCPPPPPGNNIVDILAPLKEHRVKHIKQPEWLSREILQSIEMRDYYKKHGDEALAKYWKKRSKLIIQKSKSRYFINSLKQNRNNPKILWRLLNDLNPKDENEMSQFLNVNDQNFNNPIEIANAFNIHFTNIIEKTRQGSDPNTDIKTSGTLKAFLSSKLPENELFQIPEIKPHEVF